MDEVRGSIPLGSTKNAKIAMLDRTARLSLLTILACASCNNASPPSPPPKDVAPEASAAPAKPAAAAAPIKCGSATCGPDQFCCNASCSICAPKDGACTMQVCGEGESGSALPKTDCKSNDDCKTFSSYCGDMPCACLAIEKGNGPPKCEKPNAVKCLVDPCKGKTAACQSGACVVTLQ